MPPPTAMPMMADWLSGNDEVFPSSLVDASEVGLLPDAVAVLPVLLLSMGEAVGVAPSNVKSGWAATSSPSMVGTPLFVGEIVGFNVGTVDGASLDVTEGVALGKM